MAQVLHKLYEFAVGQASYSSSSSDEEYDESSSYVTDSSEESRSKRLRRRQKREKKKKTTQKYDDEESAAVEKSRPTKKGSQTGSNHRQRESSSGKSSSSRGKTSSTSTTSSSSSTRKTSSTTNTKNKSSTGNNKERRGTSSSSPVSSTTKTSKTNKQGLSNANSRYSTKERNPTGSSLSSSSRKQTLTDTNAYTHPDQKTDRQHTTRSSSASTIPMVDEDVSSITSSVALNEYSTMSRYIQRSKSLPRSSTNTQTNNNISNNNTISYQPMQSKSTFETQLQHPTSNFTNVSNNHRLVSPHPYENVTSSPYYSFPNQNNSLLTTSETITHHGLNSSSSSMHPYQERNVMKSNDNNPTSSTTTTTYPIHPDNAPASRTANTFDSLDATVTPLVLYPSSAPPVSVPEAAHTVHPMVTTLRTSTNQHQSYSGTQISDSNNPYLTIPLGVMQRSTTTDNDITSATRPMPQKRVGSKLVQEFNEISHRISPTSAASALLLPYPATNSAAADFTVAVPPNTLKTKDTNEPNSSSSAAHNRLRTTATGTSSYLDYLVKVDQEKQQLHDANLTNLTNDKVSSPVTQTKSSTRFHSSISKLVETFPALNGKKGMKHGVGTTSNIESTAEGKKKKPNTIGDVLQDATVVSTLLEKNLLRHNNDTASRVSATGSYLKGDINNHTSITTSATNLHSVDKILQDLDEQKFPYQGYVGGGPSYADAMSPARFSTVSDGQSLSLCYTASEQGSMTYSLSDVVIKENKTVATVPSSEEALLIELLRQNTPQSHIQMLELLRRPSIPNEGSFVSCEVQSDEEGADDKRSESENGILSLDKSDSSNDATETSSITLDEEEKPKLTKDQSVTSAYGRTAVSLLNTEAGKKNNLVRDTLKSTLPSPTESIETANDCSSQLIERKPSTLSEKNEKSIESTNSPNNVTDFFVEKSCESSQSSLPQPMRIFPENNEINNFAEVVVATYSNETTTVLQSDGDVKLSSCKPSNLYNENIPASNNKKNTSELTSSLVVTSSFDLNNDPSAETVNCVEDNSASLKAPSAVVGIPKAVENHFNIINGVESMPPPPPPPSMPPPKRKSGQSNNLRKTLTEGRHLSVAFQPLLIPPKPSTERFHDPQNTPLPPPPPPSLPPEIIKVDTSNESVKVNLGSILAKRKAAATLIQKVSRRWINGQFYLSVAPTTSNSASAALKPSCKIQETKKADLFYTSNNQPFAVLDLSSMRIQRWFRQQYLRKQSGLYGLMHVERRKRGSGYDCSFYLLKLGAIKIQKIWRRSFCRNLLVWLVEQEYCVCVLQTFFRTVFKKICFVRIRSASIVIQSVYRSMKAKKNCNHQSDLSNSGAISEMFHANFDSMPLCVDEITSEMKASTFSSLAKSDWECWGAFADVEEDSNKTEGFSISSFPTDPFFRPNSDSFSKFKADFSDACENELTKTNLEDQRSALERITPAISVQKVSGRSESNGDERAKFDSNTRTAQSSALKDQPCINTSIPIQLATKPQDLKEDDVSSYGSKSELSDSAWDRFDEGEDHILTFESKNRRIARVPILKQFLPTKSSSKKKSPKSRFAECSTQYIPPRIELSPTSEAKQPPISRTTHIVSPSPKGKLRKQIRSLPSLNEGDEPGFIPPRPTYSASPRSMFYSKKHHDEACEEIF